MTSRDPKGAVRYLIRYFSDSLAVCYRRRAMLMVVMEVSSVFVNDSWAFSWLNHLISLHRNGEVVHPVCLTTVTLSTTIFLSPK